jgi:hypothetical protein
MIKDISDNYYVSLGFAEKAKRGDFDYENFPSKLGGKPVNKNLIKRSGFILQ